MCCRSPTVALEASHQDPWSFYQNTSWLKSLRPKGFFVRSAEQSHCPCCSGRLKVIGSDGSSADLSRSIVFRSRPAARRKRPMVFADDADPCSWRHVPVGLHVSSPPSGTGCLSASAVFHFFVTQSVSGKCRGPCAV